MPVLPIYPWPPCYLSSSNSNYTGARRSPDKDAVGLDVSHSHIRLALSLYREMGDRPEASDRLCPGLLGSVLATGDAYELQ